MTTALAVIVDASVVTVVALLACRALRRKPAALRHLVLAASLAAVATVPILEIAVPHWDIPVLTGTDAVTTSGLTLNSELTTTSVVDISYADAPMGPWSLALVAVWAVGFAAVMAGLLVGLVRLMITTRRSRLVQSKTWFERAERLSREYGLTRSVDVLESPDRSLLLTWGLFRPRIIVPAGASAWSPGRIDVVLAHELAHIARRDWLVQITAEVVRALHWFNPLVWMTSRCLRDESEYACDDAVLRRGLTPVDYASHLLAVARHVAADGRKWASAPAVADPSTLERRIAAMLNVSRTHATLTRTRGAFTVLAALALTVPLAAITLTERSVSTPAVAVTMNQDVQLVAAAPAAAPAAVPNVPARPPRAVVAVAAPQEPGSVSGTVRDASGAVLPGVMLTLTSTVSDIRFSNVSDVNGQFIYRNVPLSTYALVAQLPGFSSLKTEFTLASSQNLQTGYLTLQVGSLSESVSVTCAPAAAAVSAERPSAFAFNQGATTPRLFMTALAAQQVPIRVGGQIRAPRRTKSVQPTCPLPPPASGTVVILESTIGVDGAVKDIKVVRAGEAGFAEAAIEAVRQWEFTPTLLNNSPVPVLMTVTVTFK